MANVDELTVLPRPRTAWQAMDAGFALARAHYGRLLLLWFCLSAPVLALWTGLLGIDNNLALLLWWWFKPLYELPLLLLLSRALFGDTPGVRQSLRSAVAQFWRALGSYLSFARLSPSRAMTASVVYLERLPLGERRARIGTLTAVPTRAYLLMVVCLHAEFLLAYALLGFLYMLFPDVFGAIDLTRILAGDLPRSTNLLISAASFVGSWLVAPFYVSAGFMLYINRRMQLEAWDIEHRFRALELRRSKPGGGVAMSALCGALAITTVSWPSQPAYANGFEHGVPSVQAVSERIEQIHQQDAFGGERTRRVLWFKNWNEDNGQNADVDPETLERLGPFLAALAAAMKAILWIAAAAAVVLVLIALRRFVPALQDAAGTRPAPLNDQATQLHPLAAGLPDDIVSAARSALARSDHRGALSVLYRGALRELMREHAVQVPRSATESDCLTLLRAQLAPVQATTLETLIDSWQQSAYAHRPTSDGDIQQLIDAWPRAFIGPERTGAGA